MTGNITEAVELVCVTLIYLAVIAAIVVVLVKD